MSTFKTYLWKEWHQNRTLAFSALGVFLGISCLPVLVNGWRSSEVIEGIILWGGPVLAVALGVYAMSREQGSIQGFWQAQPICMGAWIMSKYVMGLCILIGVCGITMLCHAVFIWMAQLTQRNDMGVFKVLLSVYLWYVMAIYSAAFVLGAWIKGIIQALILSIGAVAVIFLVPVLIPWLNPWSLIFMMQASPEQAAGYCLFVLGMILFCAAMVGLFYQLVSQQKQVVADQKVMAWSTVVILLMLGASALFPIGNNLRAQQILDLPVTQQGRVEAIATQGNQALVLLSDGPNPESARNCRFGWVRAEIKNQTLSLEKPFWFMESQEQEYYTIQDLVWSQDHDNTAYVLVRKDKRIDTKQVKRSVSVIILRMDNEAKSVVSEQDLTSLMLADDSMLSASLDQDRLYIYQMSKQDRLLVFSLEDPQSPALISDEIVPRLGFEGPRPQRNNLADYQVVTVSDSQHDFRITHDLTRKLSWPWAEIQGNRILGITQDWVLTLFEEKSFDQDRMVLKPISYRPRNAVQKLLTFGYISVIDNQKNWAVCGDGLGVSIYRVKESDDIERVGHYAVGKGFRAMAMLPDNRVLLGNDKLHVLQLQE